MTLSPPADNPQHNSSEADSRSLDQLLAFIQGGEEGEGGGVSPVTMTTNNSSKTGKKKKKTKKIHVRKSCIPLLTNYIPLSRYLATITPGNRGGESVPQVPGGDGSVRV